MRACVLVSMNVCVHVLIEKKLFILNVYPERFFLLSLFCQLITTNKI